MLWNFLNYSDIIKVILNGIVGFGYKVDEKGCILTAHIIGFKELTVQEFLFVEWYNHSEWKRYGEKALGKITFKRPTFGSSINYVCSWKVDQKFLKERFDSKLEISWNGSETQEIFKNPLNEDDRTRRKFRGGSYKSLKTSYTQGEGTTLGGNIHHTPENQINGLDINDGPSIQMETEDHRETPSSGGGVNSAQDKYRKEQESHIKAGDFDKAMEMDINDITKKFGNKYDSALREMVKYSKDKGFITTSQMNTLLNKIWYNYL